MLYHIMLFFCETVSTVFLKPRTHFGRESLFHHWMKKCLIVWKFIHLTPKTSNSSIKFSTRKTLFPFPIGHSPLKNWHCLTWQQKWLQLEAVWFLLLVSCLPRCASLLLEGGECPKPLSALVMLLFCSWPPKFQLCCCFCLVQGLLTAQRWTRSSCFLVNFSHCFVVLRKRKQGSTGRNLGSNSTLWCRSTALAPALLSRPWPKCFYLHCLPSKAQDPSSLKMGGYGFACLWGVKWQRDLEMGRSSIMSLCLESLGFHEWCTESTC